MYFIKSKEELEEFGRFFDDKFYIAGAGNYGGKLGSYFNSKNISWIGYVDVREQGSLHGKEICSYEGIKYREYERVLISSIGYAQDICDMLIKNGVEKNKIVCLECNEIIINILLDTRFYPRFEDKVKKIKNIHKGKRGFVIGNGPSLDLSDLEKLKNEITFASNSIYGMYNYTDWRPDYYCIIDPVCIKHVIEKKTAIIDKTFKTFFTGVYYYDLMKEIEKDRGWDVCYLNIINKLKKSEGDVEFSDKIDSCVYSSGSVTGVLLQLAVYMGLEEIYLLGVDFSFAFERNISGKIKINNVVNYNKLIEKEEEELYDMIRDRSGGYNNLADIDLQLWGYQAAKRYANTHGIKIYNATRGGKLEVFERVNIDSLF